MSRNAASPGRGALLDLLRRDGLTLSERTEVTPLTGGVSSEIHLVRDGDTAFVVKSALDKLRVSADWRADPGRNRHEQLCLLYVGSLLPHAVPRIVFAPENGSYFCMEYFGDEFVNWKTALLRGDCDPNRAREAMILLARIHAASRENPSIARDFDTTANFRQLRIDPYLLTVARRHPALAPMIEAEASRIERTRECLVHGDFSPKNILLSPDRLVLLDCEAAWFGDPAFDVAFFLNHLCLKALHHAPREPGLRALFDAAQKSYFALPQPAQDKDALRELDRHSARLLLILMIARVDGKSPVEYLVDDKKRDFVRRFVSSTLPHFNGRLDELGALWFAQLAQSFHSA